MSDSVRPHRRQSTRLPCPWDSPGKNIGVGCHLLPQGIFPTQGWNPCLLCLLHRRRILYPLSYLGSPHTHTHTDTHTLHTLVYIHTHTYICIYTHIPIYIHIHLASLVAQWVMNLPAMQETWVRSQGWEAPLEKEMATHSRILAWKIPWTEESGRL